MLHWLHYQLSMNPLTGRYQRRLLRRVKQTINVPDLTGDVLRICRKIKPAAVLDIGAYIGTTIIPLVEEIDGLTVHAFEPAPTSAAMLRKRVAKYPNVHVHELAVADEAGTRKFFVNRSPVTNSLLDNDAGNIVALGDEVDHVDHINVTTVRLDDWVPQHVPQGQLVVKADVQGAEGLMIAGGRRTFTERVSVLMSEVNFSPLYVGQTGFRELYDLVTDLGFVIFDIYPGGRERTGRAGWADVLWVKPSVLPV